MITCKSPREIKLMMKAGEIVALAHEAAKAAIKPGLSTLELDKICEDVIRANGARPSFKGLYGFPNACCISVNNVLVHGIPSSETILKEGDIVSVDIGACYKGYHGDSAWTYAVGEISDDAKKLMEVTEQSLYEGLKMAKAGNHLTDISHAIETYVYAHGFSIPQEYTGHGIGTAVHEDPIVPNYGKPHKGVRLKEGMCLAVEPMVHFGKPQTRVLDDEWTVVTKDGSLAAHFEHSIVIPKEGCKILTTRHDKEES